MARSEKIKIGIVGGGIQGLALAYFLSQKSGYAITIFERQAVLGGLLGLLEVNGVGLEGFYHHWFTSHSDIIDLAKELGLGEKLIYRKNLIGLFYQDRIYSFTTARDLMSFSPVSLWGRVRLGLSVLRLRLSKDYRRLESVTAVDWLVKHCGREAYQIVWEPLLEGKFGDQKGKISMAWFWGRVHERGNSPFLVYPKGGFRVLIEAMSKRIIDRGGEIRTGFPIESIESRDKNVFIKTAAGDHCFDKVFVTTPVNVFLRLVKGLPQEYVQRLNGIKYRGAHVTVLILKKSLLPQGYYWLNVNDRKLPLLAIVEHTNLIPKEGYGNRTIVYLGNYPDPDDQIMSMSDQEVIELYLKELPRINPDFNRDWLEEYYVFKDKAAQPIVDIFYRQSIPSCETPIGSLYLVTMAQIYPWDRGTNNAVKQAKDIIQQLKL